MRRLRCALVIDGSGLPLGAPAPAGKTPGSPGREGRTAPLRASPPLRRPERGAGQVAAGLPAGPPCKRAANAPEKGPECGLGGALWAPTRISLLPLKAAVMYPTFNFLWTGCPL